MSNTRIGAVYHDASMCAHWESSLTNRMKTPTSGNRRMPIVTQPLTTAAIGNTPASVVQPPRLSSSR